MFRQTTHSLILLLGFWCCWITAAWAQPAITQVSLNTEKEVITLDADLSEAFNEKMKEAIESGVAMTFTYEIEFLKHSQVLGDEVISENTIIHTVQYDTLKKTYQFSSKGKNVNRKVTTKSAEKYQELMLTLRKIPVAHVFKLDPEEKYYARVKAEMEADGLWFPFNYLLFFVPFDEFETSWTQSTPLTIKIGSGFWSGLIPKEISADNPCQGGSKWYPIL